MSFSYLNDLKNGFGGSLGNNYFSLTPSDISRVKFSVKWRGYSIEEVDEFLELLEREYSKLWKENIELKNQLEFLRKELETYKKMENIINESVVASKKLAEDIKYQAQNEAKYIISKAIKEAEDIRIECHKNISSLVEQINRLKELRNDLINETRRYLKLLLDKLDHIEDVFKNEFLFSLPYRDSSCSLSLEGDHKDKEVKKDD